VGDGGRKVRGLAGSTLARRALAESEDVRAASPTSEKQKGVRGDAPHPARRDL